MKQLLFSAILAFLFANVASAEVNFAITPVSEVTQTDDIKAISPELAQLTIDKFLNLTPNEYKNITGEKLGFKKTIQLKLAQKALKHELKKNPEFHQGGGDGITKGLYVLLAILGLGWLAMGLKSDWEGSDWIINLVLTLLCWLPGLIHALIKMKDYYK